MTPTRTLPIRATASQAYSSLWRHRALHLKAIWPPVVFLVTAEFLYHRVIGNASGLSHKLAAALSAPWYMLAGAAVAWLLGLKFLLSFSISWRRHLLLGDQFDPFFFKRPFWKYLGFLLITYAWTIPLLALAGAIAALIAGSGISVAGRYATLVLPLAATAFAVWAIIRQAPFFTVLALDPPQPGWRRSVVAMRGNVLRYLVTWIVVMLPVALLNLALDGSLQLLHADPHHVAVALGESAFRQAMLFVHFSLGASVGAATYIATLADGPTAFAASAAGHTD